MLAFSMDGREREREKEQKDEIHPSINPIHPIYLLSDLVCLVFFCCPSFFLTLPDLALPCLTLPYLTLYLALPYCAAMYLDCFFLFELELELGFELGFEVR